MVKRNSKVIGFSVPPEIYDEVLGYARNEKKTKSELFREMVSVYRRKKEEEEYNRLLEYGRLKAFIAGINSEDDMEKGIDKFNARGLLEKYKNVELRELENTAWPKAVESKHEHN